MELLKPLRTDPPARPDPSEERLLRRHRLVRLWSELVVTSVFTVVATVALISTGLVCLAASIWLVAFVVNDLTHG